MSLKERQLYGKQYGKEAMDQSTKPLLKSKEVKSNKYCYCKVGRAITKWGLSNREKSYIAIAILED